MKAYTSIEQSKKIAEILPLESADGYWFKGFPSQPYMVYTKGTPNPGEHISCWSLAALEELMPFKIIKNNERFEFYQVKSLNKQGGVYRFGYKTSNNSFLFETSWYNDVIDAAFEMVCWLKENRKI